jgi:hypothetical protein
LQRVTDIYSGAQGLVWRDDFVAGTEELSRIMPALEDVFGEQVDATYMWTLANLHHYNSPQDATDFLFAAGIRA